MSGGSRLRALPLGARLGISASVACLLGGFAASAAHVEAHHEGRDERPGLTVDDLVGAYHGIEVRAPLAEALRAGHPEGLADADRALLLAWLDGDDLSRGYDDIDLGAAAPAEVLDASCVECHARGSEDEAASELPLEFWDDVSALAYSRSVQATDVEILVASTHTHALSLGAVALLAIAALCLTRWPRSLVGGLSALLGLGLAADLASWWLARASAAFTWGVVAGGAAFALGGVLALLLVLADLWLPERTGAERPGA